MFRIAICDDESAFLDLEKKYIELYLDQKRIESVIDCFVSGASFINAIKSGKSYDLVLLDVEIPNTNGIDIAHELCSINPQMRMAFVSAHANYATMGYHVNAVRFILKSPDDIEKYIRECIDYVLDEIEYDNRRATFEFTIGEKEVYINDILYIESKRNYVQFILSDTNDKGIYKLRCSMTKVTEMMEKYDFVPIIDKYCVNLKHVSSVKRYVAIMDNGIELRISQKKYDEVKKRYTLYKGARI